MTRKAIVTASDSGIGKASAVELARAGYDVGVTWHEDERGAEGAAEEIRSLGRTAEVRRLDLMDAAGSARVIEELGDALGGIDVFINNAGTGHSEPFLEHSLDAWDHVLGVNLTGAFVCGQVAARRMVANGNGGRIINVTSVHEHVPLLGSSAYCASKGGLGLLTKVMALELAEHGITVNNVAPGEIATGMNDADDADVSRIRRPHIPVGRPGDAREVAKVVVHLADGETTYTTGETYVVDGGLLLMAAIPNQDDR